MPSNQPVKITFDRAVDKASVASRFRLEPSAAGVVGWPSPTLMVFSHAPLRSATQYRVVLDPGYRDLAGNVNSLRHGWPFRTEPPPGLAASDPTPGERDVDPAAYITLSFSREMDAHSLAGAVTLSPAVELAVRTDPADARRVILAPQSLLTPNLDYSVTVTQSAHDVDGNALRSGFALSFSTGVPRPLHHWVGFATDAAGGTAGDGVWMVDENQFPRQVAAGSVDAFSWSPDGSRLLVRSAEGVWSDQPIGGSPQRLPIQATWAAFLGAARGYAYLDGGRLRQLLPDGSSLDLASGVSEAAVGPRGLRIAFVSDASAGGSEVWAYDLDLRSRYRIQAENGPISGIAWAPEGSRLAYRLGAAPVDRAEIRVRSLTGAAGTTTVAIGEVGNPAWQADSRHLIFAALLNLPAGPLSKAFRVSATDVPTRVLDASTALPVGPLSAENPQPSPDGHQIAFLSTVQSHTELWLMNADGTGLKQLTAYDPAGFPYSCRALAWTNS